MGNYVETKEEIYNYICARTPFVIMNTAERERVERMLREIAQTASFCIEYYTDINQVSALKTGDNMDTSSDPFIYAATMLKKRRNVTFVIGDIKRIDTDSFYSRELLNLLYLAKETNNTIIVISADSVWQRLVQFGLVVSLDYPDIHERMAYIGQFTATYKDKYPVEWDEQDVQSAAALLSGFSEIQIENILSTSILANRGLKKNKLYELTEQKSKLYTPVSCVELIHVSEKMLCAGLENLKEWLMEKRKVFFSGDEKLSERGLSTPKGILLAGVPGCGKSLTAKMTAYEWGLPLFRFDIGTVYNKWVGESESNMKLALKFIDNVAPCVLWVDEIEKALAVSAEGNDTGKRVLGQFLFWLQESKSRVFLVTTANDVKLLPSELFRKGRFSEIFFLDLPEPAERAFAIQQYAQIALWMELTQSQTDELVKCSEGFSYADIENTIKELAQLAVIYGQNTVSFEKLKNMFKKTISISVSNPEAVKTAREWGEKRARPASKKGCD